MRANLELTGGLLMAEAVSTALASGSAARRRRRSSARPHSGAAEGGRSLRDELIGAGSSCRAEEIDRALDPARLSRLGVGLRRPRAGGARGGAMSDEPRARDEGAARGARRRARGRRRRADLGVHGRVPGPDHALRVGRDLDPPGPRPAHAQRDHADGADRARALRGAAHARARRAAQRPGGGRDQGGPAPERDLLRRAGGQHGVRRRPGGPGGEPRNLPPRCRRSRQSCSGSSRG